jgi:hypothetical protein
MKNILKVLVLISIILFVFTSTSQAATLRGANTKLEADKVGSVWRVGVCTLYAVKTDYGRPGLRASTALGNKVIKMFDYLGSDTYKSKKDYWPGKKMRCYDFKLDVGRLSKVKASWVRKFFQKGDKSPVKVSIGPARGVVTLNV